MYLIVYDMHGSPSYPFIIYIICVRSGLSRCADYVLLYYIFSSVFRVYIYKHVLALYAPLTALGNIEGTNSEKNCV